MSRLLNDLASLLSQRSHRIHRIAEIRGDGDAEMIELLPATPCQNAYSIAKAFTVTAIGLLSDRGLLSVDETVPDALGRLCPASFDPLWKTTTVHMLLTHRLGLPRGFLDIDTHASSDFGTDFLAYTMNHPLSVGHGRERTYTDAAFYLLSCIAENRASLPLDDFLWRELFLPLGFRDAAWSHCPMRHAMGATGLYLRTDDMVRLGALYAAGGIWRGRRLLSESWVQTVFSRGYELSPIGPGAYAKGGMLGQNLIVLPGRNHAVAWHAADPSGQEGLAEFILAWED